MGMIIKMPLLNINDESATLVRWLHPDGASVHQNEPICVIETTKSAVDLCAEVDGILRQIAPADKTYLTGHIIGFIAASIDESIPTHFEKITPALSNDTTELSLPKWTKKAQILANRLGVDLIALGAAHPGVLIGEELVTGVANSVKLESDHAPNLTTATHSLVTSSLGIQPERILILGGGGGAALVLDILSDTVLQQAIGILDNSPEIIGTDLMGVPVIGNFDLAIKLWHEKKFDALISTVVKDIADRAAIFERFTQIGIPFTNVIASTANVRKKCQLGTGNLVVHGSYIATGVILGNNNFLAAGTYIEHHSIVGNHCTFGPRTSLSGRVKVADRVKFGTHVAVEPFIEIGTESVIASGVVLTCHVPPYSIVKNTANSVIRHVR
jgi:sugar O-acyltransferase (sialic acid O-acetyltransferase NeuD family)